MEPVTDKDQIWSYFKSSSQQYRASALLGFQLQDFDPVAGWARVRFEARPDFCNPGGNIQGGIITAFLDEVMSVSLWIHCGLTVKVPTLEMKTSFLRPLQPGPCEGVGQVQHKGKSFGFIEGRLMDADGQVCAIASATSTIRPRG